MAAEQEHKELSMAEILASIRKILEESGADEALRRKEEEDEVFELDSSMIVREEPQPVLKSEIPSAAPGRLMSEALKMQAAEEVIADEAASVYFAPKMPQKTVSEVAADEKLTAAAEKSNLAVERNMPAEEIFASAVEKQDDVVPAAASRATQTEKAAADVSEEIIDSFTRMFEQNDFRRRAELPAFDADALLRGIVKQTVAEKLDNKMLQEMVRETVIPVLEEWLSHYLPKLVAEEVERVMVKAGRR